MSQRTSHEDDLNPADRELEDALRSLSPALARIDPIAAAFAAGEKSAQRVTHVWQSLAAIVTVALIGSWMIPTPHHAAPGNQFVEMAGSNPPQVVTAMDAHSVMAMQEAIRDRGIGALPKIEVPAVRPFDAKDMF
jgi:hypothetical protein